MDHDEPASPTALLNRKTAERAMAEVERRGLVDGRRLQSSLAWLRPVDSIWWAWVERYLLAADIPKLDLFHWSEDTTNLPAGLVRDLLELTLDNQLTKPGSLSVLGTPIDLGAGEDGRVHHCRVDRQPDTLAILLPDNRVARFRVTLRARARRPPPGDPPAAGRPRRRATAPSPAPRATPTPGSSARSPARAAGGSTGSPGSTAAPPAPARRPAAPGNDEFTVVEPAPGAYVRQRLD